MRRLIACLALAAIFAGNMFAGIDIVRSNGITLTGADGIRFVGIDGIALTGADGFLANNTNGITLTGADGIPVGTGGVRSSGPDGVTYGGPNGITLTGADGITLTGADGIRFSGPNGITLIGPNGNQTADSVVIFRPNGITLTGADGITLTGADGVTVTGPAGVVRVPLDGITLTGADGITLTGADGITLTGADGITLTGADSVIGIGPNGVVFNTSNPTGITLTGADSIAGLDLNGITLTGADGIHLRGLDAMTFPGEPVNVGLQGFSPELASALNTATDDSTVNAVIVYHSAVTTADIQQLTLLGVLGGTRFRRLPMVVVTATKQQIVAISHLARVRSIYGNRTLNFNSDPYFNITGIQRAAADDDVRTANGGLPLAGRNVTVAVLDTGINTTHPDLAGQVVQNVRLLDVQGLPVGFQFPAPIENVANTDLVLGHGTFVSGVIAGNGASSSGQFGGVASGARLLGLSAGDASLTNVLSGYDYILDHQATYHVRVVNCSFSANTVFDYNDPVNLATKMLADSGVNVVFSAGNSGPGNGSLNPYAQAPWVVSTGATDQNGVLAGFSSRGNFGSGLQHPTLVAPGVNVVSVRSPTGVTGIEGVGAADATRLTSAQLPFYTTASGTSFSAPQVSAAIALMLEADATLTPAQIKDILARTATPLPRNFYHEAGAGMLNTHAAVLEAKFPSRKMGTFRSTISRNALRFDTSVSQTFSASVVPGAATAVNVPVASDTIQSAVTVSWGLSTNDFGLKVFDGGNVLVGESNYLNLTGLTGLRERVLLNSPAPQTYRAEMRHTFGTGTTQAVFGTVESTIVDYPQVNDLGKISSADLASLRSGFLRNLVAADGNVFRPTSAISRFDLAEGIVRAGRVPQYMRSAPMYSDVTARDRRNVIESVQTDGSGQFIYDASTSGQFRPNDPATRLVTAIAMVKAARLETAASQALLSQKLTDYSLIPASWRGYVAVALQYGFIRLDGNSFRPSRSLTRLELAVALDRLATL